MKCFRQRVGRLGNRGICNRTNAYGKTLRSFNGNKYGYQGSEKNEELGANDYYTHFRGLDVEIGRWKGVDPVYQAHESPYASMGNNPVMFNDVLGNTVEDWFKNLRTGEVKWHNAQGKEGEEVSVKGSDDTWENLGVDQYSEKVIDAVGEDIMNKPLNEGFIKYVENPSFGSGFFFAAAARLDRAEAGLMETMTNNVNAINEAINLSILTHRWVDNGGWTELKNIKEHIMGMFLLSYKYNTTVAEGIGFANEARGLIINDRQNGNMMRAILGMSTSNGSTTAFEWKDLSANKIGIAYFMSYKKMKK